MKALNPVPCFLRMENSLHLALNTMVTRMCSLFLSKVASRKDLRGIPVGTLSDLSHPTEKVFSLFRNVLFSQTGMRSCSRFQWQEDFLPNLKFLMPFMQGTHRMENLWRT